MSVSILDFILIGIGLAMDAFAVSICKGLGMTKVNKKQLLIIALFFGGFQAGMPLIGYYVGVLFAKYVTSFSHWIAFVLLLFIGAKMIIDAVRERKDDDSVEEMDKKINFYELILLAIATSIDALMVGVTFAFDDSVNIWIAIIIIGLITFVISAFGVVIGNVFGSKYKFGAALAGGIILILIGLKVLLEGLGVINLSFL